MSNTQPTILNPWYVVVQQEGETLTYFVDEGWDAEDASPVFNPLKRKARVFLSLSSACRVAKALGADVLVVWSGEKAREFKR